MVRTFFRGNQGMIAIDKDDTRKLYKLFEAFKWNYLPDAILEGTMGRAIADDAENPHAAVLEAPNLKLSILGGDAGHPSAREYIEQLPRMAALLFASEGWEELVQSIHGGKVMARPRYAFTSEKLDIEQIRTLGSQIPDGYRIAQMALALARRLGGEKGEFAEDHMANFLSPEEFTRRGFGFCLLHGDEFASVATTFAICHSGY